MWRCQGTSTGHVYTLPLSYSTSADAKILHAMINPMIKIPKFFLSFMGPVGQWYGRRKGLSPSPYAIFPLKIAFSILVSATVGNTLGQCVQEKEERLT